MTNAHELKAKAKRLYDHALTLEDGIERLANVFRAIELEMNADALEQEQGVISKPQAMLPAGGGDHENG